MGEENVIKLLAFKECVNWELNDESGCLGRCCHFKGAIPRSTVSVIACTVWEELLVVSVFLVTSGLIQSFICSGFKSRKLYKKPLQK